MCIYSNKPKCHAVQERDIRLNWCCYLQISTSIESANMNLAETISLKVLVSSCMVSPPYSVWRQ